MAIEELRSFRVGISSDDIDLEVVHLLKHCFEKMSNTVKCLHFPLVVEMAHTTPKSLRTRPGHQLPLLGVLNASCRRHKVVVSVGVAAFDD